MNSGFAASNDYIPSWVTIVLWLLIVGSCIISLRRVQKLELLLSILAVSFIVAQTPVNGESLYLTAGYALIFIAAFLFTSVYDFTEFRRAYITVMYSLAVVSLIGLALCVLFPWLENLITLFRAGSSIRYTYWGVFVKSVSSIRNYGMYWEPGAYQTFLNLAILLEALSEKPSKKKIYVLAITVLTTLSTTGYIALCVIALTVITARKKYARQLWITVATGVVLGFVLFGFVQRYYPAIASNVFGKITGFIENDFEVSQGSASTRYYAVMKPWEIYLGHPFWGVGYIQLKQMAYQYTFGINTCTFVNWFAINGTIYGLIMWGGYIRFCLGLARKKCNPLLVISVMLLIIVSENYTNTAIIHMIVLYGYSGQAVAGMQKFFEKDDDWNDKKRIAAGNYGY